jgi:hypothetical protein
VRSAMWLCLVVAALAPIAWAHAENTDDSLRVYAVDIVPHSSQSRSGTGVYLGKGLVITAAHVVGHAADSRPNVRIAGLDLPANVVKEGAYEQVDLTLLSVDEQKLPEGRRQLRMPLCRNPPWAGDPAIIAIPEGTARSRIMSPRLLPPALRAKFATVISDVASTGNSGSGVFDAWRKCLLGIMSRKVQVRANNGDAGSEVKISPSISCRLRPSSPSYQPNSANGNCTRLESPPHGADFFAARTSLAISSVVARDLIATMAFTKPSRPLGLGIPDGNFS